MAVPRRIIIDLVEGDLLPVLSLRFPGLDLSDYTPIALNVERENGTRFSRPVTPDGSDPELGTVSWQAGDLVEGRHEAEVEFVTSGSPMTLPRRYTMILNVRSDLN
jgi:hypothetical protein